MMKPRSVAAAALMIAAIGLLGWGAYSRLNTSAGQIPDVSGTKLESSAKVGAERPKVLFEEAKRLAASRASELANWTGSAAQLSSARDQLNARPSELFDGGFYIVDRRSRVVAFDSTNAPLAQQIRKGTHIDAALSGQVSISTAMKDPLLRTDVVAAAAPLKDPSGKVTGVLVASMKVAGQMSSRLEGLGDDRYLLDPQLRRISLGSSSPVQIPPSFVVRAAGQPVAGPSRWGTFRGPSGSSVRIGFAEVSDGWTVLAVQEVGSSPKGPAARLLREALLMLGLLLGAGLILGGLLFRAWRRAEAKSESAKRSLLAVTGHELRTPLSVIRGFGQTLVMRWDKIGDEQRRSMVDTLYRQARNLEHLIERLLTGAQLEAGQLPAASPRSMDVAPPILAAVQHQRAMSPVHDFETEITEPLEALADSKAIERVMTHLLENAVRFSPSGGTVWVRARTTTKGVEISVEDEGVGLPSDIKSIFNKFSQSEDVDTRIHEEGGLGLGLFITRSHVEGLGGTIRAERRKPAGARFTVTLKK